MPLYIEPHAGVQPLLQVVASAHRELDIGVYLLTDKRLLAALKAAHARGVDVRVIIEGKPFGMKPWQVRREENGIAATGVTWKIAPYRFTSHGDHYAFYHAKFASNGVECAIGTANMDWSALGHKNREYLYVTKNPAVVSAVHAVFNADWTHRHAPESAHRVLVLSPGTSAAQLLEVIDQPGPIDAESEELGPYRPILDALAAKGKNLRLLLPASINAQDHRDVAFLRAHGVQVRLMPVKPLYMHAKMLCGGQFAFVGSENFTQTSLGSNRELGLILGGRDIPILQAQFNRDWARAAQGSGVVGRLRSWWHRHVG